MDANWIVYFCLLLGLSSALVAGVFQSFSDFIMRGLVLSTAASGIESMQQINRTVLRSAFLAIFLLLVPVTLGFAIYARFMLEGYSQIFIIAAAVAYLITVFLVTVIGNIPMNQRLASIRYTSEESKSYWLIYGRVWTRWNHIRTICAIVTAVCFLLAAISFN